MRTKWTEEMLDFLQKNYADNTAQFIAGKLNLSKRIVYYKAFELKLKKSEEFKRSMHVYAKKNTATQFKKGIIPWNKGLKMPEEYKNKNSRSLFKKGHIPKNAKFDGALSVRKDKTNKPYVFIRVSMRVWVPLHRYLWEQWHGPIPENYNVVFADGNLNNFSKDNIILLSNADLMKRNSIHRYPEEIQELIKISNKLKQEIIKQLKNGNE